MARLLDSPYATYEDSFAAACAVVQRRRMMDSPMKRAMVDIAERYNADFTIPLPDVEGEPEFPALSAAIIADAIDSAATRANDTTPGLMSPPIDPTAKTHRDRSHTRRRAWSATWFESQLPLRLARAYRQSFGYGTFCLMAVPDFDRKRARIITRDPLLAYAEPMGPDEVRAPRDIGFVYGRSSSFLRKQYPESAALIQKWMRNEDDLWDVLEWIDGDQVMVGILGKRQPESYQRRTNVDGSVNYGIGVDTPMEQALLLRAYPNRAGMVPGCCPASVTLDRAVSSLKRIIPIVDLMNKIAALDFLAAERGVFPDRYVVGDGQGTPKIVGGTWQDGRTGNVNLLEDVKTIGELQTAPGPMTQQLLSMLERNARVSAGNPSVFQGEMSGSVRSGQTINQLGAFAVDPRIKEAHLIMQYALQVANEGVAAIELGYWPARKYVVFSGWAGDNSHVSYVPEDIFTETKQNVVCADPETEVLTDDGWRSYDQLSVGDPILTINPTSLMSEWQPIEDLHVFHDRTIDMVSMEGQDHSSLTTPDHRWLVLKPKYKGKRKIGTKAEFTTSAELRDLDAIPLCAPHAEIPVEPKFSDALVEAVAWFWTEGHIRSKTTRLGSSGVTICQSEKVNPHLVARIRAALTGVFGPALEHLPMSGRPSERTPAWRETVNGDNRVFRLTANAGRVLIAHAPDRVPTFDFLRALTSAQLELFIATSISGDGWVSGRSNKRQTMLEQKDVRAAEAFQFACILSGRATSLRANVGGSGIMHLVTLRTRTTLRPKAASYPSKGGSFNISTVPYQGTVWCPQVANRTWLARRRGSVYFTGNCYPMPGMDVTSATIALAQLNGAKMMSRKTARNKHPLIDDGAVEEQQMMSEALGDAIEMASMQQVQAGTLAFSDLVAVQMKVDEGMTLGQAMVAQHKEAQARQATEAPPPDQSQGQVASPEAQPGLNDPNAGGQMPPGAPPGPENMVGDQRLAIRSLVGALRGSEGATADSGPSGGAPVAAAR